MCLYVCVYVFSWFMCVQIKIDFFKHEEIVQLGNGLYSVMIKRNIFRDLSYNHNSITNQEVIMIMGKYDIIIILMYLYESSNV